MKKENKQWTFKAAWGKVAMVSWGNRKCPGVLLVHGFMDSAATFIPLIDQLPDKYYYVAFDMPGHGKSDPWLPGLHVSQLHMIESIRLVVEHLKWKKFIFIGHSMGCLIGMMYHHIYPDYISKMIYLDVLVPVANFYYFENVPAYWFSYFYKKYFSSYKQSSKPRLLSYDKAISLVVRNRNLLEEQAEVVLSRSLVPMGIDSYKFSWDPRLKYILILPVTKEVFYTIMTSNCTPTLSIEASETREMSAPENLYAKEIFDKCELILPNFFRIPIKGGHDIHITSSEVVAPLILDFLNEKLHKNKNIKSKI